MKKIQVILLIFILSLSCTGCENSHTRDAAARTAEPAGPTKTTEQAAMPAEQAVPSPASGMEETESREIVHAIDLNLVTEELQSNYDEIITSREMSELLGRVIELRNHSLLPDWKTLCAKCDNTRIDRFCGAVFLMKAAQTLGDLRMNAVYDMYFTDEKAPWSVNLEYHPFELSEDEEIFISGPNGTDYSGDPFVGSLIFSFSRCSRVSYLPLLEFSEGWDFRSGDSLTREEAILAAVRLYDSFEDEPEYVTLDEAAAGSTVPQTVIDAAPEGVDVTGDRLPLWKGVGFDNRADSNFWVGHYLRDDYVEEFRFAAEEGFNFFRIMQSFTSLQFPDYPNDLYQVNEKELETLDQVISFGLVHGIHIQISCFAVPGRHAMSGYNNGENYYDGPFYPTEKEWKSYTAWWEMLAKRYQNIPNAYLSFELCSEWHPGDQGKLENFSRHMDETIAAIREISPDRLLMAGFDGDLSAAECMAEKGVALSFHCYVPNSADYINFETVEQFDFVTSENVNEYRGIAIDGWPNVYGDSWSAEKIYVEHIKPFHELAKKYDVGFMIGEWGAFNNPFYEEWHLNQADVAAYMQDMVTMFEEKGIAWNHFALAGRNAFMWSGVQSGFSRIGSSPKTIRYQSDDHTFEFIADRELLDIVLK